VALVTGWAVAAVVSVSLALGPAPTARLRSEQKVSPGYGQGIARVERGWILSGTTVIARVNEKFKSQASASPAIPPDLASRGYNHVGDIDVVGDSIYVPLEQPNYELGEQVTARYDVNTLELLDSVLLAQHENSFVSVDPKTMTAYSLDRFGGDAVLRYDVNADWAPLPPLPMSRFVDKVQGGDVSGGFIWLSTSDPTNELFRVDLATGEVVDLGSAGHKGGEGEGIDATKLKSGRFHTLTIDPKRTPVWLGHFRVSD